MPGGRSAACGPRARSGIPAEGTAAEGISAMDGPRDTSIRCWPQAQASVPPKLPWPGVQHLQGAPGSEPASCVPQASGRHSPEPCPAHGAQHLQTWPPGPPRLTEPATLLPQPPSLTLLPSLCSSEDTQSPQSFPTAAPGMCSGLGHRGPGQAWVLIGLCWRCRGWGAASPAGCVLAPGQRAVGSPQGLTIPAAFCTAYAVKACLPVALKGATAQVPSPQLSPPFRRRGN